MVTKKITLNELRTLVKQIIKEENEQSQYKVFGVFRNGDVKLTKNFKLLPDNYIQVGNNEPAPIEDYGDYMLFKNDVTKEEAYDLFLKKI
jgi:hypothetical protein